MTEDRYIVKPDAVHASKVPLWDTVLDTWYDGRHHDDAFYAAGIPAWPSRERAQEVADELNAKARA